MKKLIITLLILILSVGCVSNSSNQNNQNEPEPDDKQVLTFKKDGQNYQVIVPFEPSKTRMYHGLTGRQDRLEISKRLQEMAYIHFNPSETMIREGMVISSDLHNRLIKYESLFDEGLNPRADQVFPTTSVDQEVTGPVIVTDVIELNFYQSLESDAPIEGIALAIVLNKFTTLENGAMVELSEETMIDWGESAARKLVSIIRGQSGMTNVPIFIGLYSLEKRDTVLPGGYVSSAFFEGRSGQFVRSKEEWLLFPSASATSRVNQLAVEFDLFKDSLTSLITSETTGVIGKGRLIDNVINTLNIEIKTSGRTFLEVQTLTQQAANLLERFNSFEIDIKVKVFVNQEVVAVVSLNQGQQDVTIIYF